MTAPRRCARPGCGHPEREHWGGRCHCVVAAGASIGVAAAMRCACDGFVEAVEDEPAAAYVVEFDPAHVEACARWIKEGK